MATDRSARLSDLYDAALDLFLGSSCAACATPGRALCGECWRELPRAGSVRMPEPVPPGLATVMSAGPYDGTLKALVNAHKEQGRLALARPLGVVLAAVVADLVRPGPVALVPVPSDAAAVRRRGHDPMLRIARRAAAQLRGDGRAATVARLLHVVRRRQDQAGLDHEARQANLEAAMAARPFHGVGAVVLVDDVVTSGATAREGQRALEAAGVTVDGIAAVASTERRRSLPIPSPGD